MGQQEARSGETDYLIERALARRAMLRSQEASSESGDANGRRTDQLRDIRAFSEDQVDLRRSRGFVPLKREAWGPSKSDGAVVPTGPILVAGHHTHKRRCSFDGGTDSHLARLKSKLLSPERFHVKLDRLLGRIRGDVVDFRDKLHCLWEIPDC